jgi:hypothetical protein
MDRVVAASLFCDGRVSAPTLLGRSNNTQGRPLVWASSEVAQGVERKGGEPKRL